MIRTRVLYEPCAHGQASALRTCGITPPTANARSSASRVVRPQQQRSYANSGTCRARIAAGGSKATRWTSTIATQARNHSTSAPAEPPSRVANRSWPRQPNATLSARIAIESGPGVSTRRGSSRAVRQPRAAAASRSGGRGGAGMPTSSISSGTCRAQIAEAVFRHAPWTSIIEIPHRRSKVSPG